MRSRPAGILRLVGSTVVSALFFALLLGGPAIAWAADPPTVAVTTFVVDTAGSDNSCCVEINIPTKVTFTAQISDWLSAKAGSLSVKLVRLSDTDSESAVCTMKDSASIGTGQGKSAHNVLTGLFICENIFRETVASFMRLKVVVNYTLQNQQPSGTESPLFILYVGSNVIPNADTAIPGSGFTLTVPSGTFANKPAFVSGQLGGTVSQGGQTVEAILKLKVVDPVSEIDLLDATDGFDIAVPTSLLENTKVVIAQEVDTGGPTLSLVTVASAKVTGGEIRTDAIQPAGLPLVNETGTFLFVQDNSSGYARVTVTEAGKTGGVQGVIVTNSTNAQTGVTDASGVATVFVDAAVGASYTLTAKDPFRCTQAATVPGTVFQQNGETQNTAISVSMPSAPTNSRPGLRNAGFEHGDLACWTVTPNVSIATQLGPTGSITSGSTTCQNTTRSGVTYSSVCAAGSSAGGVTILPSEGSKMAVLSTAGSGPATMSQSFTVPNGVSTLEAGTAGAWLRFNYNYVSEELPEWKNTGATPTRPFQDPFNVYITPVGQSQSDTPCSTLQGPPCRVVQVTVDTAGGTYIGNCGFTGDGGGDTTCSQSGWKTAAVNLSQFAGDTTKPLTLTFTVANAGDALYETRVLVDSIGFGTVWIDVKVLSTSTASTSRLANDLLRTSDIMSQAGLNVRRRRLLTSTSNPASAMPTGIADGVDVTHQLALSPNNVCYTPTATDISLGLEAFAGVPPALALKNKLLTSDEHSLMSSQRSMASTGGSDKDINVYYLDKATGVSGVAGWTANSGDFCTGLTVDSSTDVNPPALNLGIMLTNLGSSNTLSHELGHALIKGNSDSPLLHGAPAGSVTNATSLSPVIQPAQSKAMYTSPNVVP